jgi:hypothetical protein
VVASFLLEGASTIVVLLSFFFFFHSFVLHECCRCGGRRRKIVFVGIFVIEDHSRPLARRPGGC